MRGYGYILCEIIHNHSQSFTTKATAIVIQP